jgi:hypothetical protein
MARDLRVPKGRKHRVDLIRYEQRRKVARSQGPGGDKVRSNRAARGLARRSVALRRRCRRHPSFAGIGFGLHGAALKVRLAATSPNPEVPPVITMVLNIENGLVSGIRLRAAWVSGPERAGMAGA